MDERPIQKPPKAIPQPQSPKSPDRVCRILPRKTWRQSAPRRSYFLLVEKSRNQSSFESPRFPPEPLRPTSPRFSKTSGSNTGELILYTPVAHFPKSILRQRSLQKGKSSSVGCTSIPQVGQ